MSKTCNKCKYGKRKMSEAPCFHCKEKDHFSPQTNRQWIENMSDEELTKTFLVHMACYKCPAYIESEELCEKNCADFWEQWLQAERKE